MLGFIMNLLRGGPFEFPARQLHARLVLRDPIMIRNAGYDARAIRIMRKHLARESNCIDVGCNQGSILKQMIRCAPRGNHIAFEPIPALYEQLRAEFPSVTVHNIALSDTEEARDFDVFTNRYAYSGFERGTAVEEGDTVETIKVHTKPLDNVVDEDLTVHLIKIDVEGAELQVLRGAKKTIERNRPVVLFEHGGADDGGATSRAIHELLSDCGLNVSLTSRWLKNQPPLTCEEFLDRIHYKGDFFFVAD